MDLSWLLFKNYLFSKRSGSLVRVIAWINLLGVSLSVSALILVSSVMNGFNASIENSLLGAQPHILIQAHRSKVKVDDMKEKILSMSESNVEKIFGFESQDFVLRTIDGNFGGAQAKGLESESVERFLRSAWGEDSGPLSPESLSLEKNQVILGIDLARNLGVYEGDQLNLVAPETLLLPRGEGPPILKVTVKALVSLRNSDMDGNLLIYDLDKSFPPGFKTASLWRGVEIRLKNPQNFSSLQEKMEKEFSGFKVQSWKDLNSALFFALKLERTVMASFLSLAVLIVSFTLVTVLALLVTQKRKDIGIMMVMGLSNKRTHIVFSKIGMWLSGIGISCGLLVGALLALWIEFFPPNILPDIYYDSTLPAELRLSNVLWVGLFASTLAFLGSYFPIKYWLRMTPTEALRKR